MKLSSEQIAKAIEAVKAEIIRQDSGWYRFWPDDNAPEEIPAAGIDGELELIPLIQAIADAIETIPSQAEEGQGSSEGVETS